MRESGRRRGKACIVNPVGCWVWGGQGKGEKGRKKLKHAKGDIAGKSTELTQREEAGALTVYWFLLLPSLDPFRAQGSAQGQSQSICRLTVTRTTP